MKLAVAFLLPALCVSAQDFTDIHLDRVAAGLVFAEGPVWSRDGYLIFSDLFNSELKKWTPAHGLTTFREPAHKVAELYNYNGNTIDEQGRLLTGGHGERPEVPRAGGPALRRGSYHLLFSTRTPPWEVLADACPQLPEHGRRAVDR